MSRDGIIKFIDSMMANEFKDGSQWKIRLSMDECSMSTRNGGSKFNAEAPFVRVDSGFGKNIKMQDLVSVLYDENHVPKWDPCIS